MVTATFKATWYTGTEIPKGVIAFRIDHGDLYAAREAARSWQKLGMRDAPFSVKVTPWKAKRNLDQNALMWALYEIEADVQNGGRTGPGTVQPMDLYERDVRDYGKRVEMVVDDAHVPWITEEYRFVELKEMLEGGKTRLVVIVSSSKMNTAAMASWIDGLFHRLAEHGVPMGSGADLVRYWQDWQSARPAEDDVQMSTEEYRAGHTICEATGEYLIQTAKDGRSVNVGHVAHIAAKGMGGDIEGLKDRAGNFLMLSWQAHRFQHDVGWTKFVATYPHLRRKVRAALPGGGGDEGQGNAARHRRADGEGGVAAADAGAGQFHGAAERGEGEQDDQPVADAGGEEGGGVRGVH